MLSSHDPPLVIACASNGRYALALAVMLKSAVAQVRPGRRLEIYAVAEGMDEALRAKVLASLPTGTPLHWVERPVGEFSGLPQWGRMTLTTYHKLTIGDWLPPQVERAVWLDVDTLVLGDLDRLERTDLGPHIVLAAQDVVVRSVSSPLGVAAYRELGIAADAKYFNAGVMVLDLVRWREEGVAAQALAYLARHKQDVWFWDQEALNAVLADRWEILDPRWNWNPLLDRLGRGAQAPTQAEPWIIHFSGGLKPWAYPGSSRHHKCYFHWLDQTAWRSFRPVSNLRGRAVAAYESSRLRAVLYPLERVYLRLVRWWTRR